MKHTNKPFALLLAVAMLTLCACGGQGTDPNTDQGGTTTTAAPAKTDVNVYVLAGPTGVGAMNLWAKADAGQTQNNYRFTLAAANDEIVAAVSQGKADIAAVATNLASTLYNKTDGKVTVLAVNTLGVLSMLTNGEDIASVQELRGKTIVTTGQGANPEYILRYVLKGNGLDPDKDVTIEFVGDGSELPGVWAENKDAVILAPQPMATSLTLNFENAKTVFDMTEEWNKIATDSALMMGCVIVRNDFLKNNKAAVDTFLTEYQASIAAATAAIDTTAGYCETYGIIPKAAVAKKAIPGCGLTFVTGTEMKQKLAGYLQVMYDASPASVGGKLPGEDFYYDAG